ncbi:NUDIX domain-containing protein [Haladaptatus sp. DFWS20]|uniref:NUDIX domain-containing protein n=1 Tax=Haladaptatus sp. DFWS20 TaxID=3403467 RepID=UPI003EB738AD
MELDSVKSLLAERAETLRSSLTRRWSDVPHRVRDPIRVTDYEFPVTPDEMFPWVAVCFVVDDGRVLLVQDSKHTSAWEPPGGKGEQGERPAETAERETREETGIDCEVTDLLFTETLRFDYGGPVFAPVLQAGFVARGAGGDVQAT